ncbi:hypothetical protein Tco_0935671 [Tanacetum coccineum]
MEGINIVDLTIEQYLMLTQGSQAPSMVNSKELENMTIAEYVEYEEKMKNDYTVEEELSLEEDLDEWLVKEMKEQMSKPELVLMLRRVMLRKLVTPTYEYFDEYNRAFHSEVEQLSNEYMLRIRKKGYVMDDVWEKCEQYHGETLDPWYDEGFEEEELWRNGDEKTNYELPFIDIKTFEIKYSFKGGRNITCITKKLDDALPLGRVNGARFKVMIRNELGRGSSIKEKPSRDFTRPLGPPSGLKGLLHMLNASVIPTKVRDIEFDQNSIVKSSLLAIAISRPGATLRGVSCSNSTLSFYNSFP